MDVWNKQQFVILALINEASFFVMEHSWLRTPSGIDKKFREDVGSNQCLPRIYPEPSLLPPAGFVFHQRPAGSGDDGVPTIVVDYKKRRLRKKKKKKKVANRWKKTVYHLCQLPLPPRPCPACGQRVKSEILSGVNRYPCRFTYEICPYCKHIYNYY